MNWLLLIPAIYGAGLLIFVGIATQSKLSGWSDFIAVITWPVSIPLFAALRVWQNGRRGHRRFRYVDLKWYQRGELRSRREGLTYEEWMPPKKERK